MSNYGYVNTKMGSFNSQRFSNGNCYPATALPHGMNFFTVQTSGGGSWFYSPKEPSFEGIRLTHMPSPWLSDYGNMLIYADRGNPIGNPYWSGYDVKSAVLEPAYISLFAQRDRYTLELAPTNSCAALRFAFRPEGGKRRIFFSCKNPSYSFDADELRITTFDLNPTTKAELTEYIVIKPSAPCEFSVEKDSAWPRMR